MSISAKVIRRHESAMRAKNSDFVQLECESNFAENLLAV